LATLSDQLSSLYVSLPAHSALVIFTGHGDPRKMAELNSRRVEFETAWRARGVGGNGIAQGDSPLKGSDGQDVKWTTEDARNLEEETERAKRGLMCMCLKR
jgi:RNA exonuclease 1